MPSSKKSESSPRQHEGNGWTLRAGLAAVAAVFLYYAFASRDNGSVSDHPSVTTRQGTVIGRIVDDGTFPQPLEAFMGIPYALPPTGQRRFREAVPVPEGNLTHQAYYLGPRSVPQI